MRKQGRGLHRVLAAGLTASMLMMSIAPAQIFAEDLFSSGETEIFENVGAAEDSEGLFDDSFEEVSEVPEEYSEESAELPSEIPEENAASSEEVFEEFTDAPAMDLFGSDVDAPSGTEAVNTAEEFTDAVADSAAFEDLFTSSADEDAAVSSVFEDGEDDFGLDFVSTYEGDTSAFISKAPVVNTEEIFGDQIMTWDYIPGVWRYEIKITDGTYEYKIKEASPYNSDTCTFYYVDSTDLINTNYPEILMSDLENGTVAVENDDDVVAGDIHPFQDGKTYYISVRAVFRDGSKPDGDPNKYIPNATSGSNARWSSALTYKAVRGSYVSIKNLKYESQMYEYDAMSSTYKHYVYFSYDGTVKDGKILAQISTRKDFIGTGSDPVDLTMLDVTGDTITSGGSKLRICMNDVFASLALVESYGSKVYYIRVYNEVNGACERDDHGDPVFCEPAAFTLLKQDGSLTKPENVDVYVKDLALTFFNARDAVFSFGYENLLEDGASWGFEIQVAEDKFLSEPYVWPNAANETLYGSPIDTFDFGGGSAAFTLNKQILSKMAPNVDGFAKDFYVRVTPYLNRADGSLAYGTPSDVVKYTVPAESYIRKLSLYQFDGTDYVFDYETNLTFTGSIYDDLEFWVSTDPAFPADAEKTKITIGEYDRFEKRFTLSVNELQPDTKYYVRARVRKDSNSDPDVADEYNYGDFCNTVTFQTEKIEALLSTQTVTTETATLVARSASPEKWITGYIFQRKEGSAFVAVAKTTEGTYTDAGLTPDTKYTYRMRPYYKNKDTGKVIYGAYDYLDVTTWGGALNLSVEQTGKAKAKLSWSLIDGVTSFEVYERAVSANGRSYDFTSSFRALDSNNMWTKVKTLKKTKTSFVVSGLTAAQIEFQVRAVRTVGKQSFYVSETVFVDRTFQKYGENFAEKVTTSQKADGSVIAKWPTNPYVSGYLVETWDDEAQTYKQYGSVLGAKVTTKTLKAMDGATTRYRIRAFKDLTTTTKRMYSDEKIIDVEAFLPVVRNVKTKVNADGSISVKWKKISIDGVSDSEIFYRVYRSKSPAIAAIHFVNSSSNAYDAYLYQDFEALNNWVPDASQNLGYRNEGAFVKNGVNTITDRAITYTNEAGIENVYNGEEGPLPGVTYYYFVQAFRTVKNSSALISSQYSAAASAVSSKITVAKPTISGLKVAKGQITVNWGTVKKAVGFVVYRAEGAKTNPYKEIGRVIGAKKLSFVDKTVVKGTKYFYRVAAIGVNEAAAYKLSALSAIKGTTAK